MWIIQWLVDRWNDVRMTFEEKVKLLRQYLLNLYVYLYAYALILYDRLVYVGITIYDRLSNFAQNWYAWVNWYVNTIRSAIKDFVDNWRAGAKIIATAWYSVIDWYVNTAKGALKDFKDNWLAGAKIISTTWKSGIDWYVNFARDALKDFKDNWLVGAKIISTTWKSGIDWYVNFARDAFKDFKDNWLKGAKVISTTWYHGLDLLVNTWLSGITLLVGTLLANIQWLTQTAFPFLLDLINNLYQTLSTLSRTYSSGIVSFFDAPADWLLGILETVAWRWVEWFVSTLLGGVNFVPPPRPVFGGGAPGGPPPGPGPGPGGQGLIWPCASRTISGYRFTPPTHNGVDIGAGDGNAIWAIRGGVVLAAGWSQSGYGFYVDIQHDEGWWSRYGHAKQLFVHQNQNVEQGQTIMTCDSTGNSTGPHLHLEVKKNGSYVDPLLVLG